MIGQKQEKEENPKACEGVHIFVIFVNGECGSSLDLFLFFFFVKFSFIHIIEKQKTDYRQIIMILYYTLNSIEIISNLIVFF